MSRVHDLITQHSVRTQTLKIPFYTLYSLWKPVMGKKNKFKKSPTTDATTISSKISSTMILVKSWFSQRMQQQTKITGIQHGVPTGITMLPSSKNLHDNSSTSSAKPEAEVSHSGATASLFSTVLFFSWISSPHSCTFSCASTKQRAATSRSGVQLQICPENNRFGNL